MLPKSVSSITLKAYLDFEMQLWLDYRDFKFSWPLGFEFVFYFVKRQYHSLNNISIFLKKITETFITLINIEGILLWKLTVN